MNRSPHLSAGSGQSGALVLLAPAAALLLGALLIVPGATLASIEAALAGFFLAWLLFRLLACAVTPPATAGLPVPDRELPVYTIIVALYREAKSVEHLVASLRALDYPPEKLDIKLVIEPYDIETWAALNRLDLGAPFQIRVAPDAGPRTKPKALNAALPFARGTFTVVFDAEDRPEPDQLRRAVERFGAEDGDLACVQARLTIDNTNDSWLARLFTAEYAAQFDLYLPGLSRLGLPLPLGGSSNHFRTEVLRSVGAWDSYNVTEDADLGMRLARLGYRSAVIESTTYEEAPACFVPWIRQRTRWFKGWMQTWAVHMRHPIKLWSELGTAGFVTFQLVVGGNVLAALVHPIFLGTLIYFAATSGSILGTNGAPWWLVYVFGTAWVAGYIVTVIVALRGLARRDLMSSGWALSLVVLHWLMLSLAAWRAAIQFWSDRYRWEKTEHGLARSSRRTTAAQSVAMHGEIRLPPAGAAERRTAA